MILFFYLNSIINQYNEQLKWESLFYFGRNYTFSPLTIASISIPYFINKVGYVTLTVRPSDLKQWNEYILKDFQVIYG